MAANITPRRYQAVQSLLLCAPRLRCIFVQTPSCKRWVLYGHFNTAQVPIRQAGPIAVSAVKSLWQPLSRFLANSVAIRARTPSSRASPQRSSSDSRSLRTTTRCERAVGVEWRGICSHDTIPIPTRRRSGNVPPPHHLPPQALAVGTESGSLELAEQFQAH
jgi:hypothetical protein